MHTVLPSCRTKWDFLSSLAQLTYKPLLPFKRKCCCQAPTPPPPPAPTLLSHNVIKVAPGRGVEMKVPEGSSSGGQSEENERALQNKTFLVGRRRQRGKKTTKDKNVIISGLINWGEVVVVVVGSSLEAVQEKGKERFTLKDLNRSHPIDGVFLSSQMQCCFHTSPDKVRKQHIKIWCFCD